MFSHLGSVFAILGLYGVVLWMSLAYWALKDARARSASVAFHLFALGINLLVPVLGLFVYLLVRPSVTLADRQAIELENEVLAGGSAADDLPPLRPCPACGRDIERDYVLCPYCHTHFAKRCPSCRNAVKLGWTLCPFCAASLDSAASQRAVGQG